MRELQKILIDESKALIKKLNLFRIAIYMAVSIGAVFLVLVIVGIPLDIYNISFVIGLGVIYSFFRDLTIANYSNKQLDKFYDYLSNKEPEMEIYIPILEKNIQGYFLKKAALYFKNDELYLEAFRQEKSKSKNTESITVRYGKDFSITHNYPDKDGRVVMFESFLMETNYQFSLIKNDKIIEKINKRVKGEL